MSVRSPQWTDTCRLFTQCRPDHPPCSSVCQHTASALHVVLRPPHRQLCTPSHNNKLLVSIDWAFCMNLAFKLPWIPHFKEPCCSLPQANLSILFQLSRFVSGVDDMCMHESEALLHNFAVNVCISMLADMSYCTYETLFISKIGSFHYCLKIKC